VSAVNPIDPSAALALADPAAGRIDALQRAKPGAARAAAARELETVFLTQLMKALRATVPENDFLPRSPSRDVYDGVFDRAVAEAMAGTDPLGMVRQLGGAQDSDTPSR
jgi:Rod binding domain-containing protein